MDLVSSKALERALLWLEIDNPITFNLKNGLVLFSKLIKKKDSVAKNVYDTLYYLLVVYNAQTHTEGSEKSCFDKSSIFQIYLIT